MAENYTRQDSTQHRCPNCGAPLRYDPQSGNLFCDHCESTVDFEKSDDVQEREFDDLVTFQKVGKGEVTCYRCSNCGAISVVPRSALATHCPYCDSPLVLDDVTGTFVKPDTVIPFELTKADAVAKLSAWRKRKWFAPRKFRKNIKENSVKGVFVPAWTFDAKTSSNYSGQVGYVRTRTVRRDGKTYTETYTEWKNVSGVIENSFDDITLRANENIPENYFRRLNIADKSKYKVYEDEFLAGYIADHYTLEPLDAFNQAKQIMLSDIRRAIVARYHADVEGTLSVSMNILSKSFKYLLIPMYVASTRFNGKNYTQYVAGVFSNEKQDCKIVGKSPVSAWKTILAVVLGLGVIGLFIWMVATLAQNGEADFSEFWLHAQNFAQKFLK